MSIAWAFLLPPAQPNFAPAWRHGESRFGSDREAMAGGPESGRPGSGTSG
jgi:hypothetical protein